jgi:hypothetical protein
MDALNRFLLALVLVLSISYLLVCVNSVLASEAPLETPKDADLRCMDLPLCTYPKTTEVSLYGTPVILRFGDEVYEVELTREEVKYAMRYSREP